MSADSGVFTYYASDALNIASFLEFAEYKVEKSKAFISPKIGMGLE